MARQSCERTYQTTADFGEGYLVNLNQDTSDELQLNATARPAPFVYVTCAARGTLVRIDSNSGAVLGEYRTAPLQMQKNPTRVSVDKHGNVWVSNQNELQGGKGSIARIGLVVGGVRGHKTGHGTVDPNPNGAYLMGPFEYNTCVDRDGDGLIHTSRGLGHVLDWNDPTGQNANGGVSKAQDEAILNYVRVAGTSVLTLAVDAQNDVWTGGFTNLWHERVDGVSGQPVSGSSFNSGCGGYGGLLDGQGTLWSARGGTGLLRYDTTAQSAMCLGPTRGDEGMGIDPETGEIWHAFKLGNTIAQLDPDGNVISMWNHGATTAGGVVSDCNADVWVAHPNTNSVGRLRTDGTLLGNVPLNTHGGFAPSGVSIDSAGKVWVVNTSNNAMRIDPASGAVGAVDLTVDLGAGAGPFTYGDMTGYVALSTTAPSGTWTTIHDSGEASTQWAGVSWVGTEPAGTWIEVEIRAADAATDLPSRPFESVANGENLCGEDLSGQFLEIRATLARDPSLPTCDGPTPVLNQLSVECCLPYWTYCTAKPFLSCGTPAIDGSGAPSASASSGFDIFAGPARINRIGMLLYTDTGRANFPFQGGTLCIHPPLRRTSTVLSGGASQCEGEFRIDMNCFASGNCGGNPYPFLVMPGTQVNCQWWGRDSVATGSFLSDGLEYVVLP